MITLPQSPTAAETREVLCAAVRKALPPALAPVVAAVAEMKRLRLLAAHRPAPRAGEPGAGRGPMAELRAELAEVRGLLTDLKETHKPRPALPPEAMRVLASKKITPHYDGNGAISRSALSVAMHNAGIPLSQQTIVKISILHAGQRFTD